jgi:PRD1 phage membrane DNA delivery
MNELTNALVAVGTAIVGLAIIAVLVSRNANTSGVIQASTSGFATDLAAAEAPVTGGGGYGGLAAYGGGMTLLGAPEG